MDNDDVKLIQEIHADHTRMKNDRLLFEDQWNEVAERVWPGHPGFNKGKPQPGAKRTERMFDSTPPLALRHFSAAMDSMVTPRTQEWHYLKPQNEALVESQAVVRYLEQVTKVLFTMRYRWRANFQSQMGEIWRSCGAFGNGGLMVEDVPGEGSRYRHIPIRRLLFSEGADGLVDKAHVDWTLTARQAARRFGEANLPQSIRNVLQRDPEAQFDFIHVVRPREEWDPRKRDAANMPFASYWLSSSNERIIQRSGFRTFPFAIGRFYGGADETYGRSPAMDGLPDIKQVNEMEKTTIRGAQKAVDPPLLLQEDGALEAFDLRSGALNYGGLDDQGRELAKPFLTGQQIPLGVELTNQKREVINLAFYVTLFQILVDSPQMTATEVLQRAQEKGVLLGPPLGRMQSEMLGPMIDRELDIAAQSGLLPEMPEELVEAGGQVDVEYDSPLNRAMRAGEGASVLRWVEASAPFVQADPRAARVINAPRAVRKLAEVFSVPSDYVNSEDEVDAAMQADEQAAQAQTLLAAAPVAAGAAKDLAQAQATAQASRI